MPLLLLLGIPLAASVGALSWNSVVKDTERAVPSLLTLALVAGAAYWFLVVRR